MTSAADLVPLNPDYAETTRRFLLAMQRYSRASPEPRIRLAS